MSSTILERKIYLIWQSNDHEKRLVVAELIEKASDQYIFYYIKGEDLDSAISLGFKGYPAFPDFEKEYSQNVIESFAMRLPARSRTDFEGLLAYWEIDDMSISDFDLISITGGKLQTDNFEFIDPHTHKRPNRVLTELAGFVYHAQDMDLRNLQMGAKLQLEIQSDNRWDPYAVKVLYEGKQIGYIKKVHSKTITEAINQGRTVNVQVQNANINGVVNSILLKVTLD